MLDIPNRIRVLQVYLDLHARCPKCFSHRVDKACAGFVYPDDVKLRDYKDESPCGCECGWEGVGHDLVPEGTDFETKVR